VFVLIVRTIFFAFASNASSSPHLGQEMVHVESSNSISLLTPTKSEVDKAKTSLFLSEKERKMMGEAGRAACAP
jgi:hypothetical protein